MLGFLVFILNFLVCFGSAHCSDFSLVAEYRLQGSWAQQLWLNCPWCV